jgi:acetolactate synthase I/III small subunit
MAHQFHTIVLFALNRRGVLERITMLIRRKMYNLEQITASDTQTDSLKRVTITFSHNEGAKIPQIMKQLQKIVEVIEVVDMTGDIAIKTEVGLFKLQKPDSLSDLSKICEIFKADIIHLDSSIVIIQGVGTSNHLKELFLALEPYRILEYSSSGQVAMLK